MRHGLLPPGRSSACPDGALGPADRFHGLLNQTWVCAANQFGTVAGQHPFGRSRITDPWGTAVAVAGGRPGVIYGVLDLKYQRECREQVGGLHNRRPELYFQ
ncbi:MAG: nitrilase-related carbon-nitrogen hydrolase [Lawsonibacter sp.]